MLEEWRKIASDLDMILETESGTRISMEEWNNPWNLESIMQFEEKSGIHLPQEFKEFSEIIGPGLLGARIHFWLPDIQTLSMSKTWSDSVTKMINNFPSKSPKADKRLIELVNNVFIFSSVDGPYLGFFDLDTYDVGDKGCDIIWSSTEIFDNDEWHLVGRSFLSFFSEYFLGNRLIELMSDDYTNGDFYIDRTFFPVISS